ncbi:MAG: hypothetical protein AWU54_339 [Candidatus Frackibacter sp. T328-2]|nr:MAG: hypothetical protein AWU54_339 [Candidatus Frackibacter sp. T328-2]
MIYNGVEFDTQQGSTSYLKGKDQEIIDIPYTDISIANERGKQATRITTTIYVYSEAEKNIIWGLLHSSGEAELHIGSHFYKKVKSGANFSPRPLKPDKKDAWAIGATFIALDPIPYDAETGDPLYD